MAQIPKGRLVKGPYKPICRDCAIYFSITVMKMKLRGCCPTFPTNLSYEHSKLGTIHWKVRIWNCKQQLHNRFLVGMWKSPFHIFPLKLQPNIFGGWISYNFITTTSADCYIIEIKLKWFDIKWFDIDVCDFYRHQNADGWTEKNPIDIAFNMLVIWFGIWR